MKQTDQTKTGKPFWIALGAGLAVSLGICLLRGLGRGLTTAQTFNCLCDGFFVTGVWMTGIGVLMAISSGTDFFDMLSYGVKSLGVMFTPFKSPKNHPRYYDYKQQRKEKRTGPKWYLVYAGAVLLALSVAMLLPGLAWPDAPTP